MPNAQVIDMLPDEDGMCFSGFDADGEKVFESVQLNETVSDSGDLPRSNIDYIRNLVHTEEIKDESSSKTTIRLDPNEFNKEENPTNIDYVLSPSEKAKCDNIFKGNLLKEPRLRGIRNLPTDVESRREILRGCMGVRRELSINRDALLIHEKAQKNCILCPVQCPSCMLHAHNRTVEKLLQQLLLSGLRQNMTSSLRDAFVEKVTGVMDRDVFLRKNTNKQGSWKFPLTDDKKLYDVSLSNNEARTVTKDLQHLVEMCVLRHTHKTAKTRGVTPVQSSTSQWCILTQRNTSNMRMCESFS